MAGHAMVDPWGACHGLFLLLLRTVLAPQLGRSTWLWAAYPDSFWA